MENIGTSPTMRPVLHFAAARAKPCPQDRLKAVRHLGEAFREQFLDEPAVKFARSFDLIKAPYPAWYAFTGVYAQEPVRPQFLLLLARVLIIQYEDFDGITRTLLFTPGDIQRGGDTPFFKRLGAIIPENTRRSYVRGYGTVLGALERCGLRPEDVDYITYDHLHTQDLRRWLGTEQTQAVFPNARLLVHRQERAAVNGLLPLQADWYCPSGLDGIPDDRIIEFNDSIQLGRGIALVHTPGHTEGNHSIVYRIPRGIRVSSENGVSSDSWSPEHSHDDAIRRYALATGAEVIINGNTQEGSNDQYISMVLEKTIAGISEIGPFHNVVPSAEYSPHPLFPDTPLTHLWGETELGAVSRHQACPR